MRSDAATRDARALANAQLESVRALRRDLAGFEDDERRGLATRIGAFLEAVTP